MDSLSTLKKYFQSEINHSYKNDNIDTAVFLTLLLSSY